VADTISVLKQSVFLKHSKTGSAALHSDIFRFHKLASCDRRIGFDPDAFFMKPVAKPNGHFYGWKSRKHINGGAFGLRRVCANLGRLLEQSSTAAPLPPIAMIGMRGNLMRPPPDCQP